MPALPGDNMGGERRPEQGEPLRAGQAFCGAPHSSGKRSTLPAGPVSSKRSAVASVPPAPGPPRAGAPGLPESRRCGPGRALRQNYPYAVPGRASGSRWPDAEVDRDGHPEPGRRQAIKKRSGSSTQKGAGSVRTGTIARERPYSGRFDQPPEEAGRCHPRRAPPDQ
jgi:hypothetical protein